VKKQHEIKTIGEVCDVIAGQSPPSSTYNFEGRGLPFFQGKADFGTLYPTARVWCDEPSKIALSNDILISVRAPVGPTNLCPYEACIGRGLSAIRTKNGTHFKYVLYFLRFIEPQLSTQGRGSTFSAITQSEIRNLEIPLPPLPIQKQIAAILEKVDAAREKRRQANQLTEQFLQSVFLEMFGDPVTNPKGWKVSKLSELGSLERGRSKHRPRNAPFLLGGPYPLVQTGEIANSSGYIAEYTQTYSERGLKQSKMWPRGTLCITIAANIAKTAILTFDACFPDSVVGFIPNDRVRTEYIQQWFSFVQKHLEESAPMVAQKNINLEILRKLDVPVPPIGEQQRFAALVEKVETLRAKQRESEKELEDLFNSLILRLSLDSFSASPIKRIGAGRRITRSGSLRAGAEGV